MNPIRTLTLQTVSNATHLAEIAYQMLGDVDQEYLSAKEIEGLVIAKKSLSLACDAIQQNVSKATYTYTYNGRRNSSGDFVIRCYKNSVRYEEGDYFTDDRHDAVATLKDLRMRAAGFATGAKVG